MNNKKYFQDYFVYYVLPIIIFTLGLFGNIIGFIVLIKRKKLLRFIFQNNMLKSVREINNLI